MTQLRPRALLAGAASFLPVLRAHVCRGTGGTVSARYCYSVWLRHVVAASERGLDARVRAVAELGPGDSLGIGLAAMLCGADTYLALDAKPYADRDRNVAILEQLVSLFRSRARIPDDGEFPEVHPKLADYSFPRALLTEQLLLGSLVQDRIAAIRAAIQSDQPAGPIRIRYVAPWEHGIVGSTEAIEMIVSQAVMEHVEDIDGAYGSMFRLLRPDGFMSHNIDYRSHGLTRDWNGHWTVNGRVWRLVKGARPYLINRLPHSAHLKSMQSAGFRIVGTLARTGPTIRRDALTPSFRHLPDDDLVTTGALIHAARPA